MRNVLLSAMFLFLMLGCLTSENDQVQKLEKNISLLAKTTIQQNQNTNNDKGTPIPEFDFVNQTKNGKLRVVYFYLTGCDASSQTAPKIQQMKTKYPNYSWEEYDLASYNGTLAYIAFSKQNDLDSNLRTVPRVWIRGKIITDRINIDRELEKVLENSSTS